MAFGAYTRLFDYLKKEPKVYEACLWLGASSPSLDNENIALVEQIPSIDENVLKSAVASLQGTLEYVPPKFSAKHVGGVRAYELARKGADFELQKAKMEVFSADILHYTHPFLLVRLKVSGGSYARSWAELLAKKLGINATLSALKRISEGEFFYDNKKALNPLNYLKIPQNYYKGKSDDFKIGKKLSPNDFEIKKNGVYFICFEEFFSIIELLDTEVKYKLNGIKHANLN